MAQTKYDPEKWLETAVRGIKDYAEAGLNGNGSLYDVVMQFPAAQLEESMMPFRKALVHFEIDEIREAALGFGDNIIEDNYDPTSGVDPQIARVHRINFDVGTWTSDASGGSTARIRLRQRLSVLFGGSIGYVKMLEATEEEEDSGGIEIMSYSGGRFVMDTINDLPVYRMVDCTLEVRVYSRTPRGLIPWPAIEEVIQEPHLSIQGDSGMEVLP